MSLNCTYRFPFLMIALTAASVATAQHRLDLDEAAARDVAYNYISAAEERFDCDFEEHAMREIGKESDERYIFQVKSQGDECDEALTYLVVLADREGKLIFRRLEGVDLPADDFHIILDQVLIHEVNPDIDDDNQVECEEGS